MVEFLRYIGHGAHELWNAFAFPFTSTSRGGVHPSTPDLLLLQEALRFHNLASPTQILEKENPSPVLNSLRWIPPRYSQNIQRARQEIRPQFHVEMDELMGATLLGCLYLVNAPLGFAITMSGLSYEILDQLFRVPTDQALILQAQSHLRRGFHHRISFPYQFLWELDATRNHGPQGREVFRTRERRFERLAREGRNLLRQYPTEDPILQVSLLYQYLYENTCVRNYHAYFNRPSRLFDPPRAIGELGCGNCEGIAQAQLAYYLATDVSLGDPYFFANQYYNDHVELVVFDRQTRKVWNPQSSSGNAQTVRWQEPAGDVYRVESWMQGYLEDREQFSPLRWEDLLLARSRIPASLRGILEWDRMESSPFRGPGVNQSIGQGRPLSEASTIASPLPPSERRLHSHEDIDNSGDSQEYIQARLLPPNAERSGDFDIEEFLLARRSYFRFVNELERGDGISRIAFLDRQLLQHFEQIPFSERVAFLRRLLQEDLETIAQALILQALFEIPSHPEYLSELLFAPASQETRYFNHSSIFEIRQMFSALQFHICSMSTLEDGNSTIGNRNAAVRRYIADNALLASTHPLRQRIIHFIHWINRHRSYFLQELSKSNSISIFYMFDILDNLRDLTAINRGEKAYWVEDFDSFFSYIQVGTPLSELRPRQRRLLPVVETPEPWLEPQNFQGFFLVSGTRHFDPRRVFAPSSQLPHPEERIRIPFYFETLLEILRRDFFHNEGEISRLWSAEASREFGRTPPSTSQVFLFLDIILPDLVQSRRHAMRLPETLYADYVRDPRNPQHLQRLTSYLSPDLGHLMPLILQKLNESRARSWTRMSR